MAPRRKLVEGVRPDAAIEREFVHSGNPTNTQPATTPVETTAAREPNGQAANAVGRVPLTTRVRADFATALKRASLERQLDGVRPNTLQDILEEALEPWLRTNGYLS